MTMQGKCFSKILVAIDGWAPSMHAADYAISRLCFRIIHFYEQRLIGLNNTAIRNSAYSFSYQESDGQFKIPKDQERSSGVEAFI
jgi:hypothetical protein